MIRLSRDQFAVTATDGRIPGFPVEITEPFYCGDEERVHAALNTLHLQATIHYADGSSQPFYPDLPARIGERIYPPASGGAAVAANAREVAP